MRCEGRRLATYLNQRRNAQAAVNHLWIAGVLLRLILSLSSKSHDRAKYFRL
jgi:hypothetical protein